MSNRQKLRRFPGISRFLLISDLWGHQISIMENLINLTVRFIAMDKEHERIGFMNTWLGGVFPNATVSRSPGVSVENSSDVPDYEHVERLKRFGYGLTSSEVGCFMAHKECWKECAVSQNCMLILESDVGPIDAESFSLVIERLVSDYAEKFDIVRLHGVFERNELISRRLCELSSKYALVQPLGDAMGSAAYIITPSAAKRLLDKSVRFSVPVDVFLGATWCHRLRFRTVKPYLLESHDFVSVIGDRRRPEQSIMRRLAIEFARAKNDFRRILYMPRHFFG